MDTFFYRFSQQLHWRPRLLQLPALPHNAHGGAGSFHQGHQWNTACQLKNPTGPSNTWWVSYHHAAERNILNHTLYSFSSDKPSQLAVVVDQHYWSTSTAGFHGDIDGDVGKLCVYVCARGRARFNIKEEKSCYDWLKMWVVVVA